MREGFFDEVTNSGCHPTNTAVENKILFPEGVRLEKRLLHTPVAEGFIVGHTIPVRGLANRGVAADCTQWPCTTQGG